MIQVIKKGVESSMYPIQGSKNRLVSRVLIPSTRFLPLVRSEFRVPSFEVKSNYIYSYF